MADFVQEESLWSVSGNTSGIPYTQEVRDIRPIKSIIRPRACRRSKDGNYEVAANNRPISLLPIASKVCERIVLDQFNKYLTENKLLTSHQSGNKKSHSTETLNILLTDNILDAMNDKKITALVLLDLSKAFDSINHEKLLGKLSTIGASPSTVEWFRSYSSNRRQYVRINSTHSDSLPVTHGVPQGAILSPLLFCIYLNDLPSTTTSCQIESYVDDSKLFLSFQLSDLDQSILKLEQGLLRTAQWLCENHVLINPDKTKFLLLGTRQMLSRLPEDLSMSFLGEKLKPSESAKDLGFLLDPRLTYDHHITSIVSSCFSKLSQINRVKKCFEKETLQLLIESVVFSKTLYCSSVWSNTTAQNINKIQSIQNFACKIITNSKKSDHVTPLLRHLNWLPVREQLQYRDSILAFKCINGIAPQYLTSKFKKRSKIHTRNTRNARNTIQIPLFRTAAGQRTFAYRGAKIWNNLNADVRENTNLRSFKKTLKSQLLNSFLKDPSIS